MDYKHVVETWLFYGIGDLFFAFHSDDSTFDHHQTFYAIMAVEKHFKALLLYHHRAEYESLSDKGENNQAQKKVQHIARSYSHDFEEMKKKIQLFLPDSGIGGLIEKKYYTYSGEQLLKILQDAYMESRYPTTKHVFRSFPSGTKGIYFDPLSSPGFHCFTRTLCEFVIVQLTEIVNVDKVLNSATKQYQHLDSFRRFKNLFLKDRWPTCQVL